MNPASGSANPIESTLHQARELLRNTSNIAVFTGAGVSAESGIPTFRDDGGLWARFPPEQFANWLGLEQMMLSNPLLVASFLVELLRPIVAAQPNAAHHSIAKLEQQKSVPGVITQNIDGLHQKAGSTHVLEIHGSLMQTVYVGRSQGNERDLTVDELSETIQELEIFIQSRQPNFPRFLNAARTLFGVDSFGRYRPNLVLFGDMLPALVWEQAVEAVRTCDCLLVVGTSHLVYPAATLTDSARARGAKIINVGLDSCPCDVWLRGRAGELLPRLMAGM